jgi:thioredoxin-dependent peroxiredoxin
MASTPAVGDIAPDFTLPGTQPGTSDHDYTLSGERGHPVVLAFYPGDETPVCTRQLCSYQHDLDVLRDLDATLWGISSQSIESHQKFQEHRGLSFPLLADVDNTVFSTYGLGSLLNRRAVFVIDADGRIAWSHVSTTGITYQKVDKLAEALRALPAPSNAYPDPAETVLPTSTRRSRRNGAKPNA